MSANRGLYNSKKQEILEKYLYICIYCNGVATCVDHVIPYSYSRCNDDDNLVASCEHCNLIALDKVFRDLNSKSQYIRNVRLHPKWAKRLILEQPPQCNGCGKIFKPRFGGSTLFYCSECNI